MEDIFLFTYGFLIATTHNEPVTWLLILFFSGFFLYFIIGFFISVFSSAMLLVVVKPNWWCMKWHGPEYRTAVYWDNYYCRKCHTIRYI